MHDETHFRGHLERLAFEGGNRLKMFHERPNTKLLVIGWNINLQSSFGVSNHEIRMIGERAARIVQ
jgi:hypothetical protein